MLLKNVNLEERLNKLKNKNYNVNKLVKDVTSLAIIIDKNRAKEVTVDGGTVKEFQCSSDKG